MGIKTYSIEDEIAKKFKEQTPARETSKVLENLMKEYLDEKPDSELEHKTLFEDLELTRKQNMLLDFLITKDFSEGTKVVKIFKSAQDEGIYSRKHHFKEAIKVLSKNEKIPYKLENNKLTKLDVNCVCGTTWPISGLRKTGGECKKCDRKLVDLSKKNKQEITVS